MRRLVLLLLLGCASVMAQVERATIVGTVRDQSGAVIPNATVTVTRESTKTSLVVQTDSAGNYDAGNLVPDSYTVATDKAGFVRQVNTGFVVQVGQSARMDIVLKVGSTTQSVEVTSQAALLQTENSSVSQVISASAVQELPLNGRNFVQLAILSAGVTGLTYGQQGTIMAGNRPDDLRPGGETILALGVRDDMNEVLIDGINDSEMIDQSFIVRPPFDDIQEFRVASNDAGAEYSRGAGAEVVVSTRSGTNQFHGDAFEFVRNSALDAKNFFDLGTAPIPPYRQNQFGGGLGGPIKRDKAFFFLDYEGDRVRQGQTVRTTVPTAASRIGNFTGITTALYDPATTALNPSGTGYARSAFSNDMIPSNRMDPLGFALVNLYPFPELPGAANNYVANPDVVADANRADARVDYQISPKNSVFVRYSIDRSDIIMPNTFNNTIGGNENSFAGPDTIVGQNGALAYTHFFSPTFFADFRFGISKFTNFLLPSPLSSPVFAEIPGRDPGESPYMPTAPILSPSGYAGLGNSRSIPTLRKEHTPMEIANFAWQRGSHSLQFGVYFLQRLWSEGWPPPGQSLFGRFNFDSSFTQNPASPGGTGDGIADFLLGYPTSTNRYFFYDGGWAHPTTKHWNGYVQDKWRATRRLTVNLGLHYQIDTNPKDTNNVNGNFDIWTSTLLVAGMNSGPLVGLETYYKNLGPRVSFAYQVNDKTVVRSGYGIFYDPQVASGPNSRPYVSNPFAQSYNITPGSLFPSNTVSQGLPTINQVPVPSISKPSGALWAEDFNYKDGSLQQWNLGVERRLSSNSSLTILYAGSKGSHLSFELPVDQPAPGPGAIQPRRPFYQTDPLVTGISYLEAGANSNFNSLQVTYDKRLSHGLFYNVNWTWSHDLTDACFDGGYCGNMRDPTNIEGDDYGNSGNDIRHRVNVYGGYQLPFGPGKPWATSEGPARWIVGGWEVRGIGVFETGLPFTVTASGSPTNTGASSNANAVPGINPHLPNPSVNLWFNPAAFSVPPSGYTAASWGYVGPNTLFGPPAVNVDISVVKSFNFTERQHLDFRAEFFNIANHPQFSPPNAAIGTPGVGSISSTARPSRQIQLALRYVF